LGMRRIVIILSMLVLSGCTGFSLRAPERWVENNTFYSTNHPSIEVKVNPQLVYKNHKIDSNLVTKDFEGTTERIPRGREKETYLFGDSSKNTHLSIYIANLNGPSGSYFVSPEKEFNNNKNVLVTNDENIGDIRFTAAILRKTIDGIPTLVKCLAINSGSTTRYEITYSARAPEELIKKPANLLSTDDWNYIYSFDKQAKESFSITAYSGTASPRQKSK
jgi:hypothetical protein